MSELGFAFHKIAWAENDKGELPSRLLLLKDGDIGWANLEDIELDAAQAKSIIETFEKHGADIPIDYHHSTVKLEEHPERVTQGGVAPAVGWIKGLDYVDGEGLYADPVEWTDPEAVRSILSKRYKYFSPVIITDAESKAIVALHSVALTNKPRTKAQRELLEAAEQWSARQTGGPDMDKFAKLKANALALAKGLRMEVAQEEEIPEFPAVDESQKLLSRLIDALKADGAAIEDDATLEAVIEAAIAAIEGDGEEEAPTEEEAAAQKAVDTITAELGIKKGDTKLIAAELASLKVKAARHDELDKRVAELEGERKAARVKFLVGEQIEAGKLNPQDEKAMDSARKLAAHDETMFANLFANIRPIVECGQAVTPGSDTKRGLLISEAGKEYDAETAGCAKEFYVAAALEDEGLAALTEAETTKLKGGE